MAPRLHAEVPPTRALGAVCSSLTLVQVEIKTKPSVVLVSPNAPFVCQLLGENVCRPVALLFAFSFALVPFVVGALLPGPEGWLGSGPKSVSLEEEAWPLLSPPLVFGSVPATGTAVWRFLGHVQNTRSGLEFRRY